MKSVQEMDQGSFLGSDDVCEAETGYIWAATIMRLISSWSDAFADPGTFWARMRPVEKVRINRRFSLHTALFECLLVTLCPFCQ